MIMRTYKVFVSSTKTDLEQHRARVHKALADSGFFVVAMENWPASPDEPKAFSRRRLDGCDLVVLLVAFRKGFVPDGETLSITQLEYEEARRRKVPVLVFLLDDNSTGWPRQFDDRGTDSAFLAWRPVAEEPRRRLLRLRSRLARRHARRHALAAGKPGETSIG